MFQISTLSTIPWTKVRVHLLMVAILLASGCTNGDSPTCLPVVSGGIPITIDGRTFLALYMLMGTPPDLRESPVVVVEENQSDSRYSPEIFWISDDVFGVSYSDMATGADVGEPSEFKKGDVVLFDARSGAIERLGIGISLSNLRKADRHQLQKLLSEHFGKKANPGGNN